ncbi:MAG: hypothetical protein AAFZ89_15050 [Bacteroidota bacterium]
MKRDYAILTVHLIELVPAYEFSKLTTFVNDIYDNFLWMEDVRTKGKIPYEFVPNEDDRLYIKKVDIGTSNLIDFMGIADHLVKATKFLAENYNPLLTVGSATLLTIDKSYAIRDFMGKVKLAFKKKRNHTNTLDRMILSNTTSLEEELGYLKQINTLDKVTEAEKNQIVAYIKNISSEMENIIIDADITIISSK